MTNLKQGAKARREGGGALREKMTLRILKIPVN